LLTALAKRQPLAQIIPACIKGISIPKSLVILFSYIVSMKLKTN